MNLLKKELILRRYQEDILNKSKSENTLIVLPTGLGKTIIALSLVVMELKRNPEKIIIFLAPTRPLVEQHHVLFEEYLDKKMIVSTGKTPPLKRKEDYKNSQIIFATPQTIENDILTNRIDLSKISLIIFDEAHNARKDYAYSFINTAYQKNGCGRVIGLSASPGSTKQKIREIITNLSIENVVYKGEKDLDVSPYTKMKKIIPITVELPEEFIEIKKLLQKTRTILKNDLENKNIKIISKSKNELLSLQKKLIGLSRTDPSNYYLIKIVASLIKVNYCIELLELEGIHILQKYFKTMKKNKSKSSQLLIQDFYFKTAMTKSFLTELEHPKIFELEKIIKNTNLKTEKIIIFSKHRDNSKRLAKILNKLDGVNAKEFLGQKTGYTQKTQLKTLQDFKEGITNILIATSVIHEGVHVQNASVGIFFEPTPSAISSIQRKGRIGRNGLGKIYVLMTKDGIDEKYYWASIQNEKRLKKNIDSL